MHKRTMYLLWTILIVSVLSFEHKELSNLYSPNSPIFDDAPKAFSSGTPLTNRPNNFTGFLPKFHPTSSNRYCDRGYAMDVSSEIGPPASGEQAYIVPDPQTILDQYRTENGLALVDCALGYVNNPCDQDCMSPQCDADIGYWSQAVLDSISDPQYKYILFPPLDYTCLGVLHLPEGNNNGQRKTIRPLYDATCAGISPYSTIHPYKLHNTPVCNTLPRIRSIFLFGSSNWTIAFMTIGGTNQEPLVCNIPAMRINGDASAGGSNCNIIHKCVFENMKLGIQLGNSDDNTIQYCVFQKGYQQPGFDSGGLVIDGNIQGAKRNVVVGNEFINMNNGVGLPYSKLLSNQQQEIPGTVIANNDIYWSSSTSSLCSKDFGGCIGNIVYKCTNSETGIDIKNGTTSTNPADRILILGNRIMGFRPSNPSGAGTGGAGEGILVHNNARNIFIKENFLINNTHGITVFPWKNSGITRRIVITNNVIAASRPLKKDPYPVISGAAIRGSAHDTLVIAYNTIFANGRSLGLDKEGTYIFKCNTIFQQRNNCNFEPNPNDPNCCLEPNINNDSSFQHSIAYLNTWEMTLPEIYQTEDTYPLGSGGTPFSAETLNNTEQNRNLLNLATYPIYYRRWTHANKKLNLPSTVATTTNSGPTIHFPSGYSPGISGYCDCSEPVQGPDNTNDPEDKLFLSENIPSGCGHLRTPLVENINGGGLSEKSVKQEKSIQVRRLLLSPNPNHGQFKIQWHQDEPQQASIQVYNPMGELVYQKAGELLPNGQHEIEIHLDQHTPGVYFVQLIVGSSPYVMKMILN